MIIALNGRIGSGKSTFSKMYRFIDYYKNCNKDNYKDIDLSKMFNEYKNGINPSLFYIEEKQFAYKLKQIISIITNCDISDLESQIFKASNSNIKAHFKQMIDENNSLQIVSQFDEFDMIKVLTNRGLLIGVANLLRDNISNDIWVNALLDEYVGIDLTEDDEQPKFTYPNWLISDLRYKNEYRALKEKDAILIRINRKNINQINHISENDLEDVTFDFEIDNNSTVKDLFYKTYDIYNKINNIHFSKNNEIDNECD